MAYFSAMKSGVIAAALLATGLAVSTISITDAAWTDQVHVAATAQSASWVPPGPGTDPFTPGESTTIISTPSWNIADMNDRGYCATMTVTSTSATSVSWSIHAALDQGPFWGTSESDLYYSGSSQLAIDAMPGNPAIAVIRGVGSGNPWNSDWSNSLIDSSKTLTITVCDGYPSTPPTADPSWYTVNSQSSGTWTRYQACVVTTITGNQNLSENPFFFGWQATLDLSGAKAAIVAAGGTVNYVGWNPDPSSGYQFTLSPPASNPVANSYLLTSGQIGAIKGQQVRAITACVYGY